MERARQYAVPLFLYQQYKILAGCREAILAALGLKGAVHPHRKNAIEEWGFSP
jgi:hypothetical protein